MDFAKLKDEQRESFDANGYLIVPNALDRETIEQVAAAADRLMDDFAYEGYYQHRRDGLVQDPTLAKLATDSTIVPLVIQLLGTHIHITNTALICRVRGTCRHVPLPSEPCVRLSPHTAQANRAEACAPASSSGFLQTLGYPSDILLTFSIIGYALRIGI